MSLFGMPEGIPCCCLSGCCEGIPLPDCITLEMYVSCCDTTVSVVLTSETAADACPGGVRRPTSGASIFCGTSPLLIYTGALPSDLCVLADSTVNVFCCLDPITMEQTFWIYISDNDLGHSWYPASTAQYFQLTLVSCDPLLLSFGATPDCSGSSCIWTWQAACFIAGTTIDTPSGKANIEALKAGDEVLDAFGDTVTVLELIESDVNELVCLRGSSGFDTGVTPEHPFLATDMQTEIQAGKLRPGDLLPLGNTITASHRERGKFTVYNLSVTGSHTFVADGYAVHNKGQS